MMVSAAAPLDDALVQTFSYDFSSEKLMFGTKVEQILSETFNSSQSDS